jgi:hypothetical protein
MDNIVSANDHQLAEKFVSIGLNIGYEGSQITVALGCDRLKF